MSWMTKQKLIAFGAIGALILVAILSLTTLNTVGIHGALYKEIIEANDYRADILPPPDFIVYAALYAKDACQKLQAGNLTEARQSLQKVEKARKEYYERYNYWQKYLSHPEIRAVSTSRAIRLQRSSLRWCRSSLRLPLRKATDRRQRRLERGSIGCLYATWRASSRRLSCPSSGRKQTSRTRKL